MIIFDLFCGAGGASIGIKKAAPNATLYGFDFDQQAVATHRANGFDTYLTNLKVIDWDDVKRKLGSPDVIWSSPPCQPFSAAGKKLGVDDPRNCIPDHLRAVEELQPKIVIMENVKGLTHKPQIWYLYEYLEKMAALGYKSEWQILNCADFGVPQTRKRLIVISRNDDKLIAWPKATHSKDKWITMANALGWEEGKVGFPRKDDQGTSPDGYRERDWFDVNGPSAMVTGKARSWTYIRPATTVSGDSRIHPPGHKLNQRDIDAGRTALDRAGTTAVKVTLEEAAILQGFPKDYIWVGSMTSQFQQVGNAVPPVLAQRLIDICLKA